jgi:hypothetical protein
MFAQGVNDRKWPDGGGARRSLFQLARVEVVKRRLRQRGKSIPDGADDGRMAPAVRFSTNAIKKRQDVPWSCAFTH